MFIYARQIYPPQTLFEGGYTVFTFYTFVGGYTVFTLSVRASVRPSVTFCFLNNLKSHCWIFIKPCKHVHICKTNIPHPRKLCLRVGILFSLCPCVRSCVCPSVTFCFLNNLSHCWIFIKPCKHVHICKTNTLDKKVRARGQFCSSYFPL